MTYILCIFLYLFVVYFAGFSSSVPDFPVRLFFLDFQEFALLQQVAKYEHLTKISCDKRIKSDLQQKEI